LTRTTYHFTFARHVPIEAVEDALVLAVLAATAVAKHPRGAHRLDPRRRTCSIDARSAAGAALLRVFFAYVLGMFGAGAFRVVTAEDLAERRTRTCRSCSHRRAAGARR
jgi:predicted outer membrane lipoprotein